MDILAIIFQILISVSSVSIVALILIVLWCVVGNRFFGKSYRLKLPIVLLLAVAAFYLILGLTKHFFKIEHIISSPLFTPPTAQDFGISQTYTYHDFTFTFPLSEEEVTDSLMNRSIITVDNLTENQIEALLAVSVFSSGWETNYVFPGGGMRIKYWKSDEKPAVEIFYKEEDERRAGYERVEIRFIHPKDIPSWWPKD